MTGLFAIPFKFQAALFQVIRPQQNISITLVTTFFIHYESAACSSICLLQNNFYAEFYAAHFSILLQLVFPYL